MKTIIVAAALALAVSAPAQAASFNCNARPGRSARDR
jgi:hypothetical protein